MNDETISRLIKKAKARNLKRAYFDANIAAEEANEKRKQRPEKDKDMREIGMIPLSVFLTLPHELQTDNKKLAKWLMENEFGKNFKTVDRL